MKLVRNDTNGTEKGETRQKATGMNGERKEESEGKKDRLGVNLERSEAKSDDLGERKEVAEIDQGMHHVTRSDLEDEKLAKKDICDGKKEKVVVPEAEDILVSEIDRGINVNEPSKLLNICNNKP